MNQTRTIRLPIHVVKELNVYLRAARELTQKLDHEPTAEEIAELVDKPVEDVKRMLGLNERVTSVDVPLGPDSDRSLLDTIADQQVSDPAELLQDEDMRESIASWLEELSDKQREVIARRFGLAGYEGATLEEVGREIGLTRERVRQIQVEALAASARDTRASGAERRGSLQLRQAGGRHGRRPRCDQRSRYFSLSGTPFHSSASGNPSFFSVMFGHTWASSAFSSRYADWSAGSSSSEKIASTGHSGSHRAQSIHSSGCITRKFGPS